MSSRAGRAVQAALLRPLQAGDAPGVRQLFRATAASGRSLVLPEADLAAYEALCLGWYLEQDGSACAVLVQEDRVVGYGMVALDHAAFGRWARGAAVRWARRALPRAALPPGVGAGTFHRLRLLDGVMTVLARVPTPFPAHFHFNVEEGMRGVRAGFTLASHADAVVAAAGLPGYFGEVNVPVARPGRARALERFGLMVVHRQPNRTLSWLAGEPVTRLTVARSLDAGAGWVDPQRVRVRQTRTAAG